MKFERIEPYVIPKTSFTGETTERLDTRVLQVLYRFDKKNIPLCSQLLDVYIEAPPLPQARKMRFLVLLVDTSRRLHGGTQLSTPEIEMPASFVEV